MKINLLSEAAFVRDKNLCHCVVKLYELKGSISKNQPWLMSEDETALKEGRTEARKLRHRVQVFLFYRLCRGQNHGKGSVATRQ